MTYKIFHLITKLELGGAQSNTLYTASRLDTKLFSVELVCGPGGELAAQTGGVKTVIIPSLQRAVSPLKDLMALYGLYRLFKKQRPDLVHTHSSKAGILGRLAARLAGVQAVVHTFHGFGFHDRQNFLKRRFFIFLEKICARMAHALVFVSVSNMKTARDLSIGSPAAHRLIRSGIALHNYPAPCDRRAKRAELGIGPSDLAVISLGNTKAQKNPAGFISVAHRISLSVENARFIFVGGGQELEGFRNLAAARGLKNSCVFTGWRTDTPQLLAAADLFMMTSLWEGLPRSLVEAFASGLPAVCYKTDGVADLIKEGINGFTAQPGDEEGLAAAAARVLLDDTLRTGLAARARAEDLSSFDIDLMVKQQEKLYLELLQTRRSEKH